MRTLLAELKRFSAPEGIVSRPSELKVYECDGWTIEKSAPELLLRPRTTARSARFWDCCIATELLTCRAARAPDCPAARCQFMRR